MYTTSSRCSFTKVLSSTPAVTAEILPSRRCAFNTSTGLSKTRRSGSAGISTSPVLSIFIRRSPPSSDTLTSLKLLQPVKTRARTIISKPLIFISTTPKKYLLHYTIKRPVDNRPLFIFDVSFHNTFFQNAERVPCVFCRTLKTCSISFQTIHAWILQSYYRSRNLKSFLPALCVPL